MSFQIFDFISRNSILFSWDFKECSTPKEDLEIVVLKSEEKMMENVRGSGQF